MQATRASGRRPVQGSDVDGDTFELDQQEPELEQLYAMMDAYVRAPSNMFLAHIEAQLLALEALVDSSEAQVGQRQRTV